MAKRSNYEQSMGQTLYASPVKNRLTQSQLLEMYKEMSKYLTKNGGVETERWLHDKMGMKKGAVVIENFKSSVYGNDGKLISPSDCSPILYEQLWEDLGQYRFWKGGQEKKIKQY